MHAPHFSGSTAAGTSNTHHSQQNSNYHSNHPTPYYHNTNNANYIQYDEHTNSTNPNSNAANGGVANQRTSTTTTTTNANNTTPATSSAHKFAPARRLAARQTLRLQIPKQQGDSHGLQNAPASYYKHSPSQLPPAPILKRSTPTSTAMQHTQNSTSPLESQKLANIVYSSASPSSQLSAASSLHYSGSGHGLSIQTATATPTNNSNKFLNLRKPSITLNSMDLRNSNGNSSGVTANDLFGFANDLSPALDINEHSPIFADITASISPSASSGCSLCIM